MDRKIVKNKDRLGSILESCKNQKRKKQFEAPTKLDYKIGRDENQLYCVYGAYREVNTDFVNFGSITVP